MAFEDGGIRVRMEGGQRALIPVERLSASDQAELVRVRFGKHLWSESGDAAKTRFYYSRLTPENKAHEGIVALISIGPDRFLFELKVHSASVDLRNYSRLRLLAPGHEVPHGYNPGQVSAWNAAAGEITRVVIQITPNDEAGVLPTLKAGLLEGGNLSVAAVSDTAGSVDLVISEEEKKAVSDLLSMFLIAQPLVMNGTIRKEPLEDQVFATSAPVPASPTAVTMPPVSPTNAEFDLLPEEEDVLARLRSGRGEGRLGSIVWTPAQDGKRTVAGLGWIRNRLVVREMNDEIRLVPFSEVEEETRLRALEQRLREFSGARPTLSKEGSLYFPEGWSDHQRENSQGLVFGRRENGKGAFLLIQAVANRFGGKPITEVAIRGDGGSGFTSVPIDAASNRVIEADQGSWSIATMQVDEATSRELATLSGSRALDIRITSGTDVVTFPLKDDHLRVSLESLRCYEWSMRIGAGR